MNNEKAAPVNEIKCKYPDCSKIAKFIPPPELDRKKRVLNVTYKCPNGHLSVEVVALK